MSRKDYGFDDPNRAYYCVQHEKTYYQFNGCPECAAEELTALKEDVINSPLHYTQGKLETIDCIESLVAGKGPFEGYLIGNVVKYMARSNRKGGVESLKKAAWYLARLIRVVELSEKK